MRGGLLQGIPFSYLHGNIFQYQHGTYISTNPYKSYMQYKQGIPPVVQQNYQTVLYIYIESLL